MPAGRHRGNANECLRDDPSPKRLDEHRAQSGRSAVDWLPWTAVVEHDLFGAMNRRPVIIDTDPGIDDAVAILLALASPELEVIGIAAVAGNVGIEHTEANGRRVCELAGRAEVPVYAGCARPILCRQVRAVVHGETGLGGADLPIPTMPPQPQHAVDWIVDTVMGSPESSITIAALGPLTNLAVAMIKEPRLPARLREIVIMGGAGPGGGNVTPAAEFNIHWDPHAAQAVFESGARMVLAPLELTRQVLATRERIARIRRIGSPVGDAVAGMLDFFSRGEAAYEGLEGGPLHDPCVIAYLLRPELFTGRRARVEIETQSSRTLGATVIDMRLQSGAANCTVLTEADADGFFDLLTDRLGNL
jgi:purine nucleosidase